MNNSDKDYEWAKFMFYFEEFAGEKVLKSDYLPSLTHFFTTRLCPIRENEEFFRQNLRVKRLISPLQTHGDNIEIIDEREAYPDTDGLILNSPDTAVYLCFADCTPVIIFDGKRRIAAVSHAGWRGTAAKIALKTAEKICHEFGSEPQELTAVVGPAISVCCYEVSDLVLQAVVATVNDKTDLYDGNHINLKAVNARQLIEYGVKKVDVCPYCTCCNNDLFFSYRKENGISLRHNALVRL